MREVLRSKVHRACVTATNLDYIGSVSIDRALMEKVDLWDYEKALICDLTNSNPWETHALPAEFGSGIISVQGGGAHLSEVGDCVIIPSFEVSEDPIEPKLILVDCDNKFVEYLEGATHAQQVY